MTDKQIKFNYKLKQNLHPPITVIKASGAEQIPAIFFERREGGPKDLTF